MTRIAHETIHGRGDFFSVLADVHNTAKRLNAQAPDYPPYDSIRRQLEAMQQWTANGREPTRDERRSINMGRVASRELEGAEADVDAFATKVSELSFYFKHWLDDDAWNALDDADEATFFPDD